MKARTVIIGKVLFVIPPIYPQALPSINVKLDSKVNMNAWKRQPRMHVSNPIQANCHLIVIICVF